MSDLRIAVIVGSTRQNRVGLDVGRWVIEQAADRPATYELVDLKEEKLPLFDAPVPPSMGMYPDQETKDWAAKVASYDGYIFVTPEYNHSIPGSLKNALDLVYAEWNNKAAGIVGYGSLGGGRAIEHLRGIAAELQIADVRQTVTFSLFTDFENFSKFTPGPQHADSAQTMFQQTEAWAAALKPLHTN